jgi:cholesterol transport system auxiliary component
VPGTVLKVRDMEVSTGLDIREMIHRLGDDSWETDFYNVHLIEPAAVLTTSTYRWLRDAGLFEHVTAMSSTLEATHLMESALVTMHGDYRDPAKGLAILEIQFVVLRIASEPMEIVLDRTYRKEVPVASKEAKALVDGWSLGLGEMLRELEEDLAAAGLR